MELLKLQKSNGSLTRSDFGILLNKFVDKEVHPEEVDLIFPVLVEQSDADFSMSDYLNILDIQE